MDIQGLLGLALRHGKEFHGFLGLELRLGMELQDLLGLAFPGSWVAPFCPFYVRQQGTLVIKGLLRNLGLDKEWKSIKPAALSLR